MERAFNFRIYPNKSQEELIQKTFGSVRYVYNHYLAKRQEVYDESKKSLGYFSCCADLTQLKKD